MSTEAVKWLEDRFEVTYAALVKIHTQKPRRATNEECALAYAALRGGTVRPIAEMKSESSADQMVVVGGELVDDHVIDWRDAI